MIEDIEQKLARQPQEWLPGIHKVMLEEFVDIC